MSEEVVVTEEITASEPETTTEAAPEVVDTPPENDDDVPAPHVETPVYEPNLKFNVHDEEHQMDEMFKSIMTDAEKEAAIRSLHAKAYGLDKVKPKYELAKERLEKLDPLAKQWDRLNESYNKKDYETFFKGLGVTDEAIYDYAQRRLDYDNLTAEEKADYDRINTERSELYNLQQEVASLRSVQTDYAAQTRGGELDSELKRPEVAAIVEKYDSVYGAGAFRNLAIDTGEAAWKTTGVDHGARDVVSHLYTQYKPFVSQGQTASAQGITQQGGRQLVVPAKKDAIPNLQGQATSPVRREISSIADLKRIRNELGADPSQDEGSYRASN